MRKVYLIKAQEAVLIFTLGRVRLKANFKSGSVTEDGTVIPGRFETENPLFQAMVESDPRFGHTITLQGGCVKEKPKASEITKDDNEPIHDGKEDHGQITKDILEVTDINGAIEYLTTNFRFQKNKLTSREIIIEKAMSKGIVFPNLE